MLPSPSWADSVRDREYGSARVLEVVYVYDGDTFRANVEGWPPIIGRSIAVRIAGVDTPEVRDQRPTIRATAEAARTFTRDRLRAARHVELHRIRRGKYFRLVADVIADGEDVGQALVAAGLAKPYDGGPRPAWP